MKIKEFSKYKIILFIVNFICIFSINTVCASNQIMKVYSNNQSIDILTNTISFEKNVILKYNQITVHADNVMITHNHDTHQISMITAFGNPIIINDIVLSDNVVISAQSLMLYYDVINNIMKLSEDVQITQSGNSIKSDEIIFFIKQKKIQAFSKESNKTVMTLLIKSI